MTTPFFSIIIPTYNRSNFITKALNSLINQTFSNWECIIIDDGSTDDTKEIVNTFVEKDNRFLYFYQSNAERSAARNNGILKAKGEWICFLDSDDYYLNSHLQNFKALIESKNNEKALYFCAVVIENGTNRTIINNYNNIVTNNIEFVFVNTIATPRACVHKTILKNNIFNTQIKIGEDIELWIRIAEKYPVFTTSKATCVQVDHENRTINTNNYKSSLSHIKTLKYILSSKNGDQISQEKRNFALSNAYFNIGKHYLYENKRLMSIWFFLKSVINKINHPQTKLKINVLIKLFLNKDLKKILNICR